jgi:hypothetical protein
VTASVVLRWVLRGAFDPFVAVRAEASGTDCADLKGVEDTRGEASHAGATGGAGLEVAKGSAVSCIFAWISSLAAPGTRPTKSLNAPSFLFLFQRLGRSLELYEFASGGSEARPCTSPPASPAEITGPSPGPKSFSLLNDIDILLLNIDCSGRLNHSEIQTFSETKPTRKKALSFQPSSRILAQKQGTKISLPAILKCTDNTVRQEYPH